MKFNLPTIETQICEITKNLFKTIGVSFDDKYTVKSNKNSKVRTHKFFIVRVVDREKFPFSLDQSGLQSLLSRVNNEISKITSDYIAEIDPDGVSILIKPV